MDQVRHWWASFLERLLASLGAAFDWLTNSLMERWDLTIFVIAVAVIVLVALIVIWRRGA